MALKLLNEKSKRFREIPFSLGYRLTESIFPNMTSWVFYVPLYT